MSRQRTIVWGVALSFGLLMPALGQSVSIPGISTIIDLVKGGARGSANASAQAAQLEAYATLESAKLVARTGAESREDAADYMVAAMQSNNAYDGRIGFTQETIEVARAYCYEGLVNRTSGPERVFLYEDGSSGTVAADIGRLLAGMANEYRSLPGTDAHTQALAGLPDSVRTGGHYVDGVALPFEDLGKLTELSVLIESGSPAPRTQAEAMADGVRKGLARNVLAHWYAQLQPMAVETAEGQNLSTRYPMEILPVAPGPIGPDGQARPAVPAYALLRAAALAPWIGASPEDPQNINETYAGYLIGLNATDMQREQIRLQVITNRLLWDLVVWTRFGSLLGAEEALQR